MLLKPYLLVSNAYLSAPTAGLSSAYHFLRNSRVYLQLRETSARSLCTAQLFLELNESVNGVRPSVPNFIHKE